MAECLKEITLQALWLCEITEEEEEEYINDQVVPLNHMVRDSYLKYLKRVLSKNLNMCSDSSNIYTLHDIEKCASLLELKALRLCMVTSLYQKAMLQMVADIKRHTKASKVFHKFEEIVSQNCLCKISKCKATQTRFLEIKVEDTGIFEETVNCVNIKTEIPDEKLVDQVPSDHLDTSHHTSFSVSSSVDFSEMCMTQGFTPAPLHFPQPPAASVCKLPENVDTGNDELHGDQISESENAQKLVYPTQDKISSERFTQSESKGSLHKINCNTDSDNSKCSTVRNTSIDKGAEDEEEAIKQLKFFLTDDTSKSGFGEALLYETATQELIRILESEGELSEDESSDQKPKEEAQPQTQDDDSRDSFWKTQRHLEKQNLHESISKMCCNTEAKVKMKNKFFDLFGFDSDEDDVWCSKEKIAQYKQKIAPIVVKHLLPYYKQKRIVNRHVFKCVASNITDKLVAFKHFPEDADVEKGVILFFSYHGFIGKPEDIWSGWDQELT